MEKYEGCVGFFNVGSKGLMWGVADWSRLDNAKWHQKLLAKYSKKYKNLFINILPVESTETSSGVYELTIPKYDSGKEIEIINN